jgi:hypothetical protein
VIYHGHVRATKDSDLLVPDGPDADAAILRFLERVHGKRLRDEAIFTPEDVAEAPHSPRSPARPRAPRSRQPRGQGTDVRAFDRLPSTNANVAANPNPPAGHLAGRPTPAGW